MSSDVVVLTDDEASRRIAETLADVGLTRQELQCQAMSGRFDSEPVKRAWFLVSSLEEIA